MKVKLTAVLVTVIVLVGGVFYLLTSSGKPSKEIQTSSLNATPQNTPIEKLAPHESEFIALIQSNKDGILKESGTDAVDISPVKITKPKGFPEGVYVANFGYIGKDGTTLATEGGHYFVSMVDGKATMAEAYDENYCNWLRVADLTESDLAFFGFYGCPVSKTAPIPSSWLTHTGEQIDFSFLYPSNWEVTEGEGCSLLLKPKLDERYWICFGVHYKTMKELATNRIGDTKTKSLENLKVGDKPAIRLNDIVMSDKNSTEVFVGDVNYQPTKTHTIEKVTLAIGYFYDNRASFIPDIGTFNQILSTMKFD